MDYATTLKHRAKQSGFAVMFRAGFVNREHYHKTLLNPLTFDVDPGDGTAIQRITVTHYSSIDAALRGIAGAFRARGIRPKITHISN